MKLPTNVCVCLWITSGIIGSSEVEDVTDYLLLVVDEQTNRTERLKPVIIYFLEDH